MKAPYKRDIFQYIKIGLHIFYTESLNVYIFFSFREKKLILIFVKQFIILKINQSNFYEVKKNVLIKNYSRFFQSSNLLFYNDMGSNKKKINTFLLCSR